MIYAVTEVKCPLNAVDPNDNTVPDGCPVVTVVTGRSVERFGGQLTAGLRQEVGYVTDRAAPHSGGGWQSMESTATSSGTLVVVTQSAADRGFPLRVGKSHTD
jgi:hypothetical protein